MFMKISWKEKINSFLTLVIGNPKISPVEDRVFNILILLFGLLSLGVGFNALSEGGYGFQKFILLGYGFIYLTLYYNVRFLNRWRKPIVIFFLVSQFLRPSLAWWDTGGSTGPIILVFFMNTVSILVITKGLLKTALLCLTFAVIFSLFLLESMHPEWVTFLESSRDALQSKLVAVFAIFLLVSLLLNAVIKALHQERQKSESLLLNILPHAIAEELKRDGKVNPVFFNSISILFTDFKGFTKIAENLTPDNLLTKLNQLFSEFDEITDQHNLEKLKTIEDSYRCAGGLPVPNKTHAVDSVLAGLKMESILEKENKKAIKKNQLPWEIRVGIHTGSVVAGVIEKRNFIMTCGAIP